MRRAVYIAVAGAALVLLATCTTTSDLDARYSLQPMDHQLLGATKR